MKFLFFIYLFEFIKPRKLQGHENPLAQSENEIFMK